MASPEQRLSKLLDSGFLVLRILGRRLDHKCDSMGRPGRAIQGGGTANRSADQVLTRPIQIPRRGCRLVFVAVRRRDVRVPGIRHAPHGTLGVPTYICIYIYIYTHYYYHVYRLRWPRGCPLWLSGSQTLRAPSERSILQYSILMCTMSYYIILYYIICAISYYITL